MRRSSSPRSADFCDPAEPPAPMGGFDCVWLCMEHVPRDWIVLRAQVLAGKVHDVDTMVRVPRGSYSDYIKPLEADATGIMVPHLMSEADAKDVVRMTRFHPVGRRAICSGNADGAYCSIPDLKRPPAADAWASSLPAARPPTAHVFSPRTHI